MGVEGGRAFEPDEAGALARPEAVGPTAAPVGARTYAELIEAVLDAEVAGALGRRLSTAEALGALAARAELIERLTRWRWLAAGQARDAGARWDDIDATVGSRRPGLARMEYGTKLARQRRMGLPDPRQVVHDDRGRPDADNPEGR